MKAMRICNSFFRVTELGRVFSLTLLRCLTAAWAGAWCTKELSRSQHNPAKFVWQNFVSALKDACAPVNVTGDAQA